MSQTVPLRKLALPQPLEALLAAEQTVLDVVPLGIYVCDADGQIVRVNQKAIALWGRAPRLFDPTQKFCGSFRVETFDGAVIPPDQTPMAMALGGATIKGAEAVVQNPDGRRWVARVDVEPLLDPDGMILGAINCFQDVTTEYEQREALERQQRTFDLAMTASQMGTWRYTLADNICIYDENAQRLYGLTEARFLHDAVGVKAKFHPADMDAMWARVAEALKPEGDGRYEVEYRVKQIDGSWRWLSAWGIVEFEGQGSARKPIAIAGASRDLTAVKKAEDLQRMLINELNHRVKNTLTIVQSIVHQTLRATTDVDASREAVDGRLLALAKAHDLLTERNWSGADLHDVVARAIEPFTPGRVDCAGPAVHVSPQHALSLSLALHELATNAAKYGALTGRGGRVQVQWTLDQGVLVLTWHEAGGPAVTAPTHRGFGSRLLERGLMRDLDGQVKLDFAPAGVHCAISVPL